MGVQGGRAFLCLPAGLACGHARKKEIRHPCSSRQDEPPAAQGHPCRGRREFFDAVVPGSRLRAEVMSLGGRRREKYSVSRAGSAQGWLAGPGPPWWEGWSATPARSGICSHPSSASQHLREAASAPNRLLIGINCALVRPGSEQHAEPAVGNHSEVP